VLDLSIQHSNIALADWQIRHTGAGFANPAQQAQNERRIARCAVLNAAPTV
jgi:hypothetical protein